MIRIIIPKNNLLIAVLIALVNLSVCQAQSESIKVAPFDEVTISPYISVIFRQANEESVVIKNSEVDRNKIKMEVKNGELHIYLEGAKITSKEENVYVNGREIERDIYSGTQAQITINYRNLVSVEIRSEEQIIFEDEIDVKEFNLDIYGSPKVFFKSITAEEFLVAMYGESYLKIDDGIVDFQRYRCYGSSEVDAFNLQTIDTKITAYGNNHVRVYASDRIKVSAFGEANIQYKGNAKINNGFKIGETVIQKID